jgi:dipeptidyl aminopeptidase/acylaminoacyl peptidase
VVDVADVVAGRDFLVTAGLATSGRVAVAGYSYGGYLALLALARYPERWAAGASLWGIVDARRSPPLRDEVLWRDDTWIAERSPAALMGRITAPLLIVHAAHDTSSTVEEVQAAAATLSRQGTSCDLQIFWDDTHGLSRHTRECCALLTSFLQRHLG